MSAVRVCCLFYIYTVVQSADYAVVTCEIELFQYYFTLRQRPSEIILFQHVKLA